MDETQAAEKGRGFPLGRILLVAIIGAVLALALSESARTKLLDLLFGAEEQFEYEPVEPAAPTGAPEGAAAA